MPMPSSSESSRIVWPEPVLSAACSPVRSIPILADLLLFENVTIGPVAATVGFAVVAGAPSGGLMAPNCSVLTFSGEPSP